MNSSTLAEVGPHDAVVLIADGALLLDVREPDEWAAGHSPDAITMPLGSLAPDILPRDRTIVAVCRSGARSARATATLTAAGLSVIDLRGGMMAWTSAGLPVAAGDGTSGSIA